jgi:PA14 domain
MPLLFATPAHADDIVDAQTALDAGNSLVVDLTLQDSQAAAVVTSAEEQVIAAQATVDARDVAVTQATQDVAAAQTAYDTQLITEITHTGDGLTATVYNDRGYNGSPPLGAGVIDHVQPVAQINFQWYSGSVLNGPAEDVQIKFTGQLSAPTTGNYQFYGPADDGFILKINGQTIINDWRDKGGGGTVSQPVFLTANQPNALEAWYYENGGGAWVQLNWSNGGNWEVIPATAFGTNTVVQTKDPNLLLVLDDKLAAYDNAMLEKSIAIDNLNAAVDLYNAALEAKGVTYNNLQTALAAIPVLQETLATVVEAKRVADEQAAIAAAEAERARLEAIAAQEAADRAAAEARAIADAQARAQAQAYAEEQARLAAEAQAAADRAAAEAAAAEAKAIADAQAAAEAAAQAAAEEAARLAELEAQKPVIIDPTPTEEPVVPTPEPTVSPSKEPTPTPSETTQPTPEPTQNVVEPLPEPNPTTTPEAQPEPQLPVTKEEAVAAISNLVDVAPEDLTDKQVAALVAAANVVFENAEQGSPAYEQALEALAVAAQADDPQLPTELAAIPGAAAVLETFNALGNVGADMAPAVRDEAEKTVIASVIAAGAAVNAATGAAVSAASAAAATTTTSSSTSSSTGSGSSSGGSSGGSGESSASESKPSSRRRETK